MSLQAESDHSLEGDSTSGATDGARGPSDVTSPAGSPTTKIIQSAADTAPGVPPESTGTNTRRTSRVALSTGAVDTALSEPQNGSGSSSRKTSRATHSGAAEAGTGDSQEEPGNSTSRRGRTALLSEEDGPLAPKRELPDADHASRAAPKRRSNSCHQENPYLPVGSLMADLNETIRNTKGILRSRASTRSAATKQLNKFVANHEQCKQNGVSNESLREMAKAIASAESSFEKNLSLTKNAQVDLHSYMTQKEMDIEMEASTEYEVETRRHIQLANMKMGRWYREVSRSLKQEEPVEEELPEELPFPEIDTSDDDVEESNFENEQQIAHSPVRVVQSPQNPPRASLLERVRSRLPRLPLQVENSQANLATHQVENSPANLANQHHQPSRDEQTDGTSGQEPTHQTPSHGGDRKSKTSSRKHRRRRKYSTTSSSGSDCNIALPKLVIPVFSGDYKAWVPFYEMFNSSIGSKKGLSQVAKMNYLRSYLRGEALETVDGLANTKDNFNAAVEALKLQYNNPRGICRMHVSDLFTLKAVETENSHDLMRLINKTNSHLHSISAQGYDTSTWDLIVIHLLTLKVPASLREQWEIESHSGDNSRDPQTLQDFKNFIIGRANARASMNEILPSNTRSSSKQLVTVNSAINKFPPYQQQQNQQSQSQYPQQNHYQQQQYQQQQSQSSSPQQHGGQRDPNAGTCLMCGCNHYLFYCEVFRKKPSEIRIQLATNWVLCKNCLVKGHEAKDCKSKNTCRINGCGQRHHTLLHFVRPGAPSDGNPNLNTHSNVARIFLNNSSGDEYADDYSDISDEYPMEVEANNASVSKPENFNPSVSESTNPEPFDYEEYERSAQHQRVLMTVSSQLVGGIARISLSSTSTGVSVSSETVVSKSFEKETKREIIEISSGSEFSPRCASAGSISSPTDQQASTSQITTPGSAELSNNLNGSYSKQLSSSVSLGGSERSGLITQLKFESEGASTSASPTSSYSIASSPEIPRRRWVLTPPSPQEGLDDMINALSATCGLTPGINSIAVLPTVRVRLQDQFGMPLHVRALLDTGSQANFISEHVAQTLGIKRMKTRVSIHSVGNGNTIPAKGVVNLSILYPGQEWKVPMNLDAFVLPQVTANCPTLSLDVRRNESMNSVALADEFFETPGRVDVLFGVAMFNHILIKSQQILECEGLSLINTIFGYSVSGIADFKEREGRRPRKQLVNSALPKFIPANQDLTALAAFLIDVSKFWEVEDLPPPYDTQSRPATEQFSSCLKDPCCYNKDEKDATDHYNRNTIVVDNRRVVKLPFNDEQKVLGDSFRQAVRMLQQQERGKFVKNPKLHAQYCAFMSEFVDLGHLELVPDWALRKEAHLCYYIPHHSVEKEASTTTKLRVVFNGSARSSTGVSLNDTLLKGPKLQDDLFYIMLRFRFFIVALSGDITKMYRQVALDEDSKDFQRILWRDDPSEAIRIFRMTRTIYGVKSSGYQVIKALQDAIRECKDPELVRLMLRDFYVDDLLSGSDTVEGAAELQKKIYEHLILHLFEVRKWSSSAPEVIANIPAELRENEDAFVIEDEDHSIKTLGICWMPMTDDFKYKVEYVDSEAGKKGKIGITKRQMLSDISRLYDPLGWVAPVTVNLKCIMQQAWVKGVDWDSRVPDEIEEEFTTFRGQLVELREISLKRCVLPHAKPKELELHVFCDASEKAYAACVYVRAGTDGTYTVTLLAAKSRVCPVKAQSIPRLELCGMHLGAKLCATAMDAIAPMGIIPTKIYGWSDSTVALAQVNSPSRGWNVFVANRVAQIQSILPEGIWHHVGTHDNPADLATRGCTPAELKTHSIWWNGPEWLLPMIMPRQPDMGQAINACRIDRKRADVAANSGIICQSWVAEDRLAGKRKDGSTSPPSNELQEPQDYFVGVLNLSRFSSFRNAIRTLQSAMLYCANLYTAVLKRQAKAGSTESINHTKFGNMPGYSSVIDLAPGVPKSILGFRKAALRYLVRNEQIKFYQTEMHARESWKDLPKSSKLVRLCPFFDKDEGTLRLGGRLFSADYALDSFKYPWILPKESPLSASIIEDVHHEFGHSSTQQTIAQLNTRFWIVGVKSAVKKTIRECVRCRRYNSKQMEQVMADLPEARVTPSDPFTHTGIDFAGPFVIREGKERSISYFCVFVCFSTKAIHLEAVMRLDTQSCYAALQRFVARRGAPTHFYSDNGTNFTSCKKELMKVSAVLCRKYDRRSLMNAAIDLGASWCMIPAVTPHFGGIWEAGVKLAKTHLKKIIGKNALTFEEFTTLLTEIEAMLNSRPMMEYSTDPEDLRVLTPAMLLTGKEMRMLPLREPGICHEELPEAIEMSKSGVICVKSVSRRWKALENRKAIFWKRWVKEYLPTLQSRKKWAHERRDLKVGDLVLLAEDKLAPLHWGMGRVLEVYTGVDFKCRCVKLLTSTGVQTRGVAKCRLMPIDIPNEQEFAEERARVSALKGNSETNPITEFTHEPEIDVEDKVESVEDEVEELAIVPEKFNHRIGTKARRAPIKNTRVLRSQVIKSISSESE